MKSKKNNIISEEPNEKITVNKKVQKLNTGDRNLKRVNPAKVEVTLNGGLKKRKKNF